MSRALRFAFLVVLSAFAVGPVRAQQLVIWHDKGDDGIRMIQAMAEQFAKDHPGITVRSVSMPTDQWFSRSTAALNTGTAPDILFNDGFRLVQIQQQTQKLADLAPDMQAVSADDRKFLGAGDMAAATYDGKLLMIPFQRVITGWGVRESWLDKVGEAPPKTWDDVLRAARKFQTQNPGGAGRVYGIAMQGGDAPSMIDAGSGMLTYGNGLPHSLVDDDGQIVIDKPEIAKITIAYLKLYTSDKLVSPDTVNQTFTDMYQLIEGGRVGMFRVGNWNVGKWDKSSPAGDYVIGPFPQIGDGTASFVVGSIRGMSVPTNSPHAAVAKEFVRFVLTKAAQQISLDDMGGVVRSDLDTSHVTPGLRPFVAADAHLQVADNAVTKFPWFLKLENAYYRLMIAAISDPPADWDAWIKDTAAKLRAEQASLAGKG
ncbi:MAG: extracellular solute-binding protein [Acetobacteraceae bacterium]|nr:extracellular solute-binding protein [Acetobacteraceae bacterium]